jgi:hypothetical protein
MKRITLFLILVLVLILVGSALAMESTNYQLDWFTLLTGGGGNSNSTNYAVNFTVGQSAIGTGSSTNYEGCLGYWCGIGNEHEIFLPQILR